MKLSKHFGCLMFIIITLNAKKVTILKWKIKKLVFSTIGFLEILFML